jgi:seryl-tRNA synthetase
MLDIQRLRTHKEDVLKRLNQRNEDFTEAVETVLQADMKRRVVLQKVEQLKMERNQLSKAIGEAKQKGEDVKAILAEVESSKVRVQSLEKEATEAEEIIKETMLRIPNLPRLDAPIGQSEADNVELKKVGTPREFGFTPKAHWDLAVEKDLLDFERAAKISASRFVIYKNDGARLERSLIQFMMDMHAEKGYQELMLPYLVNAASMTATGQFPKFKEDAFEVKDDRNLYLNPTAEVPGINIYRDEILKGEDLPLKYTAFTTAFRQEAGSAGRDTRGIIRQHQFNKVELLKFTKPEESYQELDDMLAASEAILEALKLPYRVIELCTADLGFSMAKTYDIEVYLPAYQDYREIGSISNAEDYQARRGNIRFKRSKEAKPEFVHTLNGSGLAIGRTWIAIVENYQNADGTITVPEVLVPYMKKTVI